MIFNENELYGSLNNGIELVPPVTQEKTANASTTRVEVEPDDGYTGLSKVTIEPVSADIDPNIKSENIKSGITILGIEGNVEPDKPDQEKTVNPSTQRQEITADTGYELARVIINGVDNTIDQNITENHILKDINILGVTGNVIELKGQTKTVNPSTSSQTITPDTNYNGITEVTVNAVSSSIDSNIQSGNIKDGVSILGVNGSVVELKGQEKTISATTQSQTITPDTNYNGITEITVNPVTSDIDANITSGNIKSGVSILGVSGSVVEKVAQSKTITPTKQEQTVSPDSNYNALSSVVVNPIPNEYIIPTGTKSITTNGTHDVSEYASANVQVEADVSEYFNNSLALSINTSGQWILLIKKLPSLTFTGTDASYLFYNYRGASIGELTFTNKITNASYMFAYCYNLQSVPLFDTSEVTNASYMFTNSNGVNSFSSILIPSGIFFTAFTIFV